MATEYKCVRCGKPAVVHITRISGNEKLSLHFCEECAKKFALDNPNIPANLEPEIRKFEEDMVKKKHSDICQTCGMLLVDLKKGDKFACPDCYSIMDDSVIDMLTQMHGASTHKGKIPKHHSANVDTSEIFGKREGSILSDDLISHLEEAVSSAMESVSETIEKNVSLDNVDLLSESDKQVVSEVKEQVDRRLQLQKMLEEAVEQDRYEDAAKIRDELNSLKSF